MAQDFTCKQCGQTFSSSDKLEQHNQQMHASGMGGMSGTGTSPGGKVGGEGQKPL